MRALAACALIVAALAGPSCGPEKKPKNQATEFRFVASVHADPFHLIRCRYSERISVKNKEWFETFDEAENAGHRPCKVCKPRREP